MIGWWSLVNLRSSTAVGEETLRPTTVQVLCYIAKELQIILYSEIAAKFILLTSKDTTINHYFLAKLFPVKELRY